MFFIISSASFSMMRLRLAGGMSAQMPLSKAARAAFTAASTSAWSQAATLVSTWPVAGLTQSKVLPESGRRELAVDEGLVAVARSRRRGPSSRRAIAGRSCRSPPDF